MDKHVEIKRKRTKSLMDIAELLKKKNATELEIETALLKIHRLAPGYHIDDLRDDAYAAEMFADGIEDYVNQRPFMADANIPYDDGIAFAQKIVGEIPRLPRLKRKADEIGLAIGGVVRNKKPRKRGHAFI